MPYIKPFRRAVLADKPAPENAGELNYCFTVFILKYLRGKPLSYQLINDVVGALEGAKAEFYRRVAVPYENAKIKENGDVYPPQ
jgi:hypothetical protein